jgi:molecular chaperone GrpE
MENNSVELNELAQCQAEVQKWKDAAIRSAADFDNYQRRITRERGNWIADARGEVLLDLLNILDNFDRALAQPVSGEVQGWLVGFEMIRKSMFDLLARYQVQPMEVARQFDPTRHEAISQVEAEGYEPGEIVQVLQTGYLQGEKVLRIARVAVAR